MRHTPPFRRAAAGFSLIEVLVSILIVVVGLLGLAGMQARAQIAELESYQRAQALVLLYDMMDRMNNARTTSSCFVTASGKYYGDTANAPAMTCTASNAADQAMAIDSMTAWHNLLQGAAETKGGSKVGAMINSRGCVTYDAATEYLNTGGVAIGGTGEFTIMVSWQGMADTFAPTKTCGTAAQYGSDAKRRTVWATMRVGTLATR
jgi:type IV pilus assembly protein PilV